MKKTLLLVAAATIAAACHAQSVTFRPDWGKIVPATSQLTARQHIAATAKRQAPAKAKADKTGLSADDIIYAVDGESRDYYRKTVAYFVVGDNVQQARMEGSACQLTFGENNEVYIYNPFSEHATYSYIKGTREGDTITFHTPQVVDFQYNDDFTETTNIYATKFRKKWLNETTYTFVADSVDTDLKYVLKGDSISLVGGDSIMVALANDENVWGGYGNAGDVMREFSDTELELPDDAEPLTYSMIDANGTGKGVKVAFKDDDVYIQGIATAHPDSWVKGKVQGDKITLPSMQYLGLNNTYNYYFYLAGAKADTIHDEEDDTYYLEYTLVPEVTMSLDNETHSFKTDYALLVNAGKGMMSYDEAFNAPVFKPFNDVKATPATPIVTTYMPYKEDVGYGGLMFIQPTEDADGNWINPDKMAYIIYTDDTAYEFTTDLYGGLEENLTEVPYSFTDDNDFTQQEGEHVVYFYEGGYSKMGVQSVYYGGGERTTSPIVYANTTGINGSHAAETPVSVAYYDLQGRRLSGAAHGLTIMKATYADGSLKVMKHIRK